MVMMPIGLNKGVNGPGLRGALSCLVGFSWIFWPGNIFSMTVPLSWIQQRVPAPRATPRTSMRVGNHQTVRISVERSSVALVRRNMAPATTVLQCQLEWYRALQRYLPQDLQIPGA